MVIVHVFCWPLFMWARVQFQVLAFLFFTFMSADIICHVNYSSDIMACEFIILYLIHINCSVIGFGAWAITYQLS
jgi:hypothetical protein